MTTKQKLSPELQDIINTPVIDFIHNSDIIIKHYKNEYRKNETADILLINTNEYSIRIPYLGGKFIQGLIDNHWEVVYTYNPIIPENIRIIPYTDINPNDSLSIKMDVSLNDDQISKYSKFRFGVKANSTDSHSKYRWGNYSRPFNIVE